MTNGNQSSFAKAASNVLPPPSPRRGWPRVSKKHDLYPFGCSSRVEWLDRQTLRSSSSLVCVSCIQCSLINIRTSITTYNHYIINLKSIQPPSTHNTLKLLPKHSSRHPPKQLTPRLKWSTCICSK